MNITVCSGNTVNISCGFSGAVPQTTVPNWRVIRSDNGSVISDEIIRGSDIESDDDDGLVWIPDLTSGPNNAQSSILVVGPVDETYNQSSYQCIFATTGGNISSSMGTITVAGPPSTPSVNVYISNPNGCLNITFTWNSVNSDPVCGSVLYEVTVSTPNSVVLFTDETSYFFDIFRYNTRYNITVVGRNDAGVGEYGVASLSFSGVIGIGVPQDIMNLRTTEITHDTITVEWDAVDGPCFITYNVAISTANGHLIDSFVVRVYQFTFMDLMSNTSYIVTVSAANQHGNGRTATINVTTGLETLNLDDLQERATMLEDSLNANNGHIVDVANEVQSISEELINITSTSNETLSPNDLIAVIEIINTITRITQITNAALVENGTGEVVELTLNNVATTMSNLLNEANKESFLQPQNETLSSSLGEDFLKSVENFAVTVGNVTSTTNKSRTISNENIIVEAQLVPNDTNLINTIVFPNDTMAATFSGTQITIPRNALIHQRETEDAVVPVVNFAANNLQFYISDPSLSEQFPEFRTSSGVVISTQFSKGPINLTEDDRQVVLKFSLGNSVTTQCVFWDFNLSTPRSNDTGGWSSDGIIQDNNPSPPVICRATHLTSFSVLVSSADAAKDSPELHIVSYVGCGVSIICLLLTIGAILLFRKTALNATHYLVHLNLSIALLFGLIVFVCGVERAEDWRCNMVAILLHYLFLCVFCWTLCEAIMIYIMFGAVFYKGIFQDIRFFALLGWGLPIPVVAISAGLSYDNYVIEDNSDDIAGDKTEIIACWISDKDGSIWAFAGPVILILLINMILLILSLFTVVKSKRTHDKMTDATKTKYETAKLLLLSTLILLPLLGGTWLLGLLFVIDNESVALAWIFTIVNSLQGAGIFYLHIVRSKEVKNVIKEKFKRWKKARMMKTSLKDTTLQRQTLHSKFVLQYKSSTLETTEYPSTKDSSQHETL
ncbi:adhesion G protein-coupled receptor L4-like isoform X2 [Dysidea avara]